jgi:hypothetical protein
MSNSVTASLLLAASSCDSETNGRGSCKAHNVRISPWNERVLYGFAGSPDGSNPDASLIFDTAGNLYGTTYYGGASGNSCIFGYGGCGTVFKLTPSTDGIWTESVLQNFREPEGAYPQAALIFDQAGNLYGTAQQGGNLSQCNPYSGCARNRSLCD